MENVFRWSKFTQHLMIFCLILRFLILKFDFEVFESFPGCNSKEMLRYIKPTLETGFYDSAILHVGVNDVLNNKSPSSIDDLESNLVKIVDKCKFLE